MLMLVITLFLFSLLLYVNFSSTLYQQADSLLNVKADGVESSIRTFWKAEKLEMTADWASHNIFLKKDQEKFRKIADELTLDQLPDENEFSDSMAVQIFDAKSGLIASSREVPAPLKKKIHESVLRGQRRFDDLIFPSKDGGSIAVRALTAPIIENGQVRYVIQVAAPLRPLQRELGHLKRVVFLRVPIVVLIASLAGLFLVHATLSPVNKMVNSIRGIKPDNLKVRIEVPDTNDEITRLAETFNKMLEGLDKSFTSQRQIVQDISHELKTPLTVLRGQIEVALKKKRSPDEYEEVLHSGLEEIDKIRRIVDSLLILARLDSHGLTMELKPVEMGAMIKSVADEIHVLSDSKNISFHFSPKEKVFINANDIHMRRLFMNLLENAIKYTPEGGSVRVDIKPDGRLVNVDINDTGIGIAEKDLPYIFDRFYRVDRARSGGEGFGLGLSLVKSIVQAHRGDIRVRSLPGVGTTFSLFFPLAV